MKNKQSRGGKVFMGQFVEPQLKEKLKKIAKAEKRSLNAQVEFFLTLGVQHLEQKQAA
jgi:hypothetical protein